MARPAPGVERTMAVLGLLAESERDLSVTDVADGLGLNKATAHATLSALADAGYVLRHPARKTYGLGPTLVVLGALASARRGDVVEHARGEMRRLADELGLQVAASAVLGSEIVIVAREGATSPFGVTVSVGSHMPMLPPHGTIFLAWAGQEELDGWLRRSWRDVPDDELQRYRQAMQAVRTRGYSIGLRTEEYQLLHVEPGSTYDVLRLIAPVFGVEGDVVLGLTLFGFSRPLDSTDVSRHGERLVAACRAITREVHGRAPAEHAPRLRP